MKNHLFLTLVALSVGFGSVNAMNNSEESPPFILLENKSVSNNEPKLKRTKRVNFSSVLEERKQSLKNSKLCLKNNTIQFEHNNLKQIFTFQNNTKAAATLDYIKFHQKQPHKNIADFTLQVLKKQSNKNEAIVTYKRK